MDKAEAADKDPDKLTLAQATYDSIGTIEDSRRPAH